MKLKLEALAKEFELEDKKLTFHLIKGDSKEKLSILKDKSICGLYNIFPDFDFIDGVHTLATVISDYEYCKKIPVIVIDDDYTEEEEKFLLEIEKAEKDTESYNTERDARYA